MSNLLLYHGDGKYARFNPKSGHYDDMLSSEENEAIRKSDEAAWNKAWRDAIDDTYQQWLRDGHATE